MSIEALSQHYLNYGVEVIGKEETTEKEVTRGVYALGLCAVAPAGFLYHISAAAYYALQTLCENNASAAESLGARAVDHLAAGAHDLLAAALTAVTLIFIVRVSLAIFLLDPVHLIMPAAIILMPLFADLDHEYLSIQLLFALKPTMALLALDSEPQLYFGKILYAACVHDKIAVEEIPPSHRGSLLKVLHSLSMEMGSDVDKGRGTAQEVFVRKIPELHRALLQHNALANGGKAALEAQYGQALPALT
ncbi:MAG: hypothetical protein HYX48_07775 [Chlamydiales bacterium]|nr:hypothetical protein [Chlamydiales bacterium]